MPEPITLDAIEFDGEIDRNDFRPKIEPQPTWCPGCGDYGVQNAIQQALSKEGIHPHETLLVTGIGCSGKLSSYIGTYGFHSLHGRVLPTANAAKMANPELEVVAAGGDGDGYGIGAGHFFHAPRENPDVTYIVFNNEIFGLTKGQTSPTSPEDHKSKIQPEGTSKKPVAPLEMSIAAGSTFVARTASASPLPTKPHEILQEGLQHDGFAHIDMLTQCPTFNKDATQYVQDIAATVDDEYDYDKTDRQEATRVIQDVTRRAQEDSELILGVFYKDPDSVPYHERKRQHGDFPEESLVKDVLDELNGEGEFENPDHLLDSMT
jgi:pyruvate ferredoxin oxidoreductase beta subunit